MINFVHYVVVVQKILESHWKIFSMAAHHSTTLLIGQVKARCYLTIKIIPFLFPISGYKFVHCYQPSKL
jgi:hypothetical protein